MQRIAYGDHPSQFGELFVPEGDTLGAVVVIHGGFWHQRYGLELGRPLAEVLVADGFAVWNIEYRRLSGGGGWPQTGEDVLAAIDAVDLGPVVTLGHSAGGHLAVWAAKHSARVAGAVAQAAVLDFTRHITGRALELCSEEQFPQASPHALVPIGKPVICVHGDQDEDVPVEQSTGFCAVEPRAELVVVEGAGHMDVITPGTEAWERCRAAVGKLAREC
ncbi:Prolyl oligopeptidase family protein [Lentzea fradiae]|uniref:Prolyl oligopeptidase family protein n=1 Tax=Lentzea fradiae TaxID=200378 RepID=A0A1G8BY87_9PSEU|nr:alpha/beta hydrolase [Lentzea fradiae]SDH38088.1 Prolyl oligopeptidase family protein [Lentzea fradiae]